MTHHFHHDLILKFLINLITIIYWWNPLCWRLNKQAAVILEMRVDDSLTRSDSQRTVEYIECLTYYETFALERKSIFDNFSIRLTTKKISDLKKRSFIMLNNQKKSDLPMSILIGCIVCGLYLGSYLFIFEGYNTPPESNLEPPEHINTVKDIHVIEDYDSYLIDNGDGTYDLYYNGTYLDTIDSLFGYNPVPPIYTPENNPHKDLTR